MNRFIILFLFSLGILSTCVFAVEVIPLNEGWNFHRGFQAPASEIVKVTLPHTWNAGDGMFGNADYYRGLCNYSRKLSVPAHYRGKRFFLFKGSHFYIISLFSIYLPSPDGTWNSVR